MEYKINISYQTGSSFHTEDREELIEYEWKNIDKAKECIQRIKNHYEFYEKHNLKYKKPEVEFPIGVIWDEEYKQISLELIDDNGNSFRYSNFWTGYFETLYKAEIKILDKKLRYEP